MRANVRKFGQGTGEDANASQAAPDGRARSSLWFAALAGLFFFVIVIKDGDPVIIDTASLEPHSFLEAVIGPWPTNWCYWPLVALLALAWPLVRWQKPRWNAAFVLPAAWLGWQFLSATQSVDSHLTSVTLVHFLACFALFYLGYFGLRGCRNPWPLYVGFALAFCWAMRSGFEQHFGGLAATREYLQKQHGAQWDQMSAANPDFIKRIKSDRIFGTFVYPNALAGAVLLFLPMTLLFVWQLTPKVSSAGRWMFVGLLGGCGLATLVWSGSKAGWLLALVMAVIAVFTAFQSRLPLKWRVGMVAAFLVIGLTGFAVRFSHYFEKGATSVSARFDYWRAAGQTILAHPILGTGPGTFSRPYAQLKRPESEMARLCHDDYLEQGSDSGVIGMILYCFFIFASILRLYRYFLGQNWAKTPVIAGVSLGLIGLCLHSFVEYHLYIPALAWPMFFLLGWLLSLE